MTNKLYEVESKYSGYLSVKESNTGIVRVFPKKGFKMRLPKESILNISYNPGGRYILENQLIIKDDELLEELGIELEPEDSFTPEEIKMLIFQGTNEQLEDALSFGRDGTKQLIKDIAIEEDLGDVSKRKIISKYTGFNLEQIFQNKIKPEEEANIDKKEKQSTNSRRRATVFSPKEQEQEQSESDAPKYHMVNGKRVRVK